VRCNVAATPVPPRPADKSRLVSDPASKRPAAAISPLLLGSGVMLGIGLKIASVFVFVAMSSLLKAAEGVPPGELVFFRSFFALVPILIFLAFRRELIEGFKTKRPWGHVWRGVIGVTGMSLMFFGLTRLPLPEAITINYATPLFIVVFSAIFVGETIRLYRWSAVLVGLVGVLIVMWPRLTFFVGGANGNLEQTWGAVAAFCSCITAAAAMIMVRNLVQTERSATIVIYFSITCSVLALLTIPFGWVWPTPQQWVLLVSAGIAGGIGQILLTECYRHADMSIIAPFEYSSMILSIIVGFFVFGDVPTAQMLVGGSIVVGAGIFIILRERRLGLERARAKEVSAPQ
jgi:drug/metabolite transporter (DMT)-like permease